MLVSDALDIRVGTSQVVGVYIGSTALWTPDAPAEDPEVTPREDGATAVYFSNAKTKTVDKPSGIVEGDTIILAAGEAATKTWTMPTGFVKQGYTQIDGPAGNSVQVWVKRADASDNTGTWTFTSDTNTYGRVGMVAYEGPVAVGPVSAYAGQANPAGSTIAAPLVNAPDATGMLAIVSAYAGTAAAYGPSAPDDFDDPLSGTTDARMNYWHGYVGSGFTDVAGEFTLDEATTAVVALHLTSTLRAPTNVVAPAVTGNTYTGQTLTCSNGTWLGVVGLSSPYTRQWQRDGEDISSATSSTYTVQSADLGHTVTCIVTATNDADATTAVSNEVEGSIHNTALPTITGTAGADNTYTAVAGTWEVTVDSREYHWLADGVDVHTGDEFTPSAVYGSRVITVREVVDSASGAGSATSTDQKLFYAEAIPFKTTGSPWYTPLPADVAIDGTMTATLQDYLTAAATAGTKWYGNGGPYGPNWSTYINLVSSDMPRQQFNVVDAANNITAPSKNGGIKEHLAWCWQTKNGGVPAPPYGFKVVGPATGDRSIVVYSVDTYEYWGAWLCRIGGSGLPTIQHGCYIPDVREFDGIFRDLTVAPGTTDERQYLSWGETAAFCLGTGLFTQQELEAASASGDAPAHAIAVELPGTNHTARYPALRAEGRGNTPIPMGGIWTLDRDLDPDSLDSLGSTNANSFRKWFIEMAQNHGVIVNDTTGGTIGFRFEAVSGALTGGSYVANSFNWGSLFTIPLDTIITSIPVENWQVVSASYRPEGSS